MVHFFVFRPAASGPDLSSNCSFQLTNCPEYLVRGTVRGMAALAWPLRSDLLVEHLKAAGAKNPDNAAAKLNEEEIKTLSDLLASGVLKCFIKDICL